jgi:restriction system protein
LAWQQAMYNWGQSIPAEHAPAHESARYFSPQELERFAGQLFKQMGYKVKLVGKSGDHGVDVRLVNPNGQVELVQCKQWHKPVGEPEVRNLAGAMVHENAIRGFIFAPGGFSQAAQRWARNKHIVLADEVEIRRMVESAYAKR